MTTFPGMILLSEQDSRQHLLRRSNLLFFRQSMIGDFLICPQMAMYRWVFNMEESTPFFSAVLGTAGHECIYNMHTQKKFDFTHLELLEMFENAFNKELKTLSKLPSIGKNFKNIRENFLSLVTEYIEMLDTYQTHKTTRSFISTMHEQAFVLEVHDPKFPLERPFLFTGQLDLGGVYEDGTFTLKDIKFRDQSFKPQFNQLQLNPQLTIYCAALKFGQPACKDCRPRYIALDDFDVNVELQYNGPCDSCKSKIGTPLWPQLFPERCELVWMRDFERYKRKYKDKQAGDMKGEGFLRAWRPPKVLQTLMDDIIRCARLMREGEFYRKPGEYCDFWCKHVDQCRSGIELRVADTSSNKLAAELGDNLAYGEDPF